jgi:hypothetical protein
MPYIAATDKNFKHMMIAMTCFFGFDIVHNATPSATVIFCRSFRWR